MEKKKISGNESSGYRSVSAKAAQMHRDSEPRKISDFYDQRLSGSDYDTFFRSITSCSTSKLDDNQKKKRKKKEKKDQNKFSIRNCVLKMLILLSLSLVIALIVVTAYIFWEVYSLKSIFTSLHKTVPSARQKFNASISQFNQNQMLFLDVIHRLFDAVVGQYYTIPASSCSNLPPNSPPGYYWIMPSSSPVRVYCDTTMFCGNTTTGWIRVEQLNMKDTAVKCPDALLLNTTVARTCRPTSITTGCSSVIYSLNDIEYRKVCGKVIAYQVSRPTGFSANTMSIEDNYLDGVSLTYGSQRQHIWSFVIAANEDSMNSDQKCSCIYPSFAVSTPDFVGNDYFCDTAALNETGTDHVFYNEDPVWDGAGCGHLNACCRFNSPPWFYKELSQPVIDDIEMRVCREGNRLERDIAIEEVQIYVQ